MHRNIIFFIKTLLLSIIIIDNECLSIIPLKKPILDKKTQNEKIPQSILKPKIKMN